VFIDRATAPVEAQAASGAGGVFQYTEHPERALPEGSAGLDDWPVVTDALPPLVVTRRPRF
jgi:hypothetical protein